MYHTSLLSQISSFPLPPPLLSFETRVENVQGTERKNAGCLPTILELLLNFIQFLHFPLLLKLSVSVMKILFLNSIFD